MILLLFVLPAGAQSFCASQHENTVSAAAPTGLTVNTGTHDELHSLSGLTLLRADAVGPEILSALKDGGITVLNHAEIPNATDTVPEYRAEAMNFDADAVIKTVLGDDSSYSLEEDAVGYHFKGQWRNGHFEGVFHPQSQIKIYCKGNASAADGFDDEAAASMAVALNELIESHLVTEFRPKSEQTQTGETVAHFQQNLDGLPLSSCDWFAKGVEITIGGSSLAIAYQDGCFAYLQLERPLHVSPTGNSISISVSAEDAVQIYEKKVTNASGTLVQDIRDVSLVYLTPQETEGKLIPAWQISYDFYTLNEGQRTVNADLDDYCCLIDAVTGEILRVH